MYARYMSGESSFAVSEARQQLAAIIDLAVEAAQGAVQGALALVLSMRRFTLPAEAAGLPR